MSPAEIPAEIHEHCPFESLNLQEYERRGSGDCELTSTVCNQYVSAKNCF